MSFETITKTYNSFSGCDMAVTCNILNQTITLGTLQTISYSIHMDRQPIRSIGNINAKDYTLGPRTIAGSLVFAVFDKHLLYHMIEAYRDMNTSVISSNKYVDMASKYKSLTNNRHILSDELPPFDITITFANEYGTRSKAAIYGVRLVNEGQVMSINDVYTENTYQFVALDIDYMRNEDYVGLPDNDIQESEKQEDIKIDIPAINQVSPSILLDLIHYDRETECANFILNKYISFDEPAKTINGGKFYINDIIDKTSTVIEIPSPIQNPYDINNIKLIPDHKYIFFFIEYDSDIRSNDVNFVVPSVLPKVRPMLERIEYVSALDQRIYFRCLGSLLHGHTKFVIKNKSEDIIYESTIDETGTAVVSTDDLRNFFNSVLYAYSLNDNGSDVSHHTEFNLKNGYDLNGLYDYIVNNIPNSVLKHKFESICDMYNLVPNELYSVQMLNNRNKFFIDDYEAFDLITSVTDQEEQYIQSLVHVATPSSDIPLNKSYYFFFSDNINWQQTLSYTYNEKKDIYTNPDFPNESIIIAYNYNSFDAFGPFIIYKPNHYLIQDILSNSKE